MLIACFIFTCYLIELKQRMNQSLEIIKHFEIIFGSAGIILSLFLSIILFINRKKNHPAAIFIIVYLMALSFRIGKSIFYNYFEMPQFIRTICLTFLLLVGPALFLHIKTLVSHQIVSRSERIFHFIPFLLVIFFAWLLPGNGTFLFDIFYYFISFHMIAFALYSIYWLSQNKAKKQFDKKSELKFWCYALIGLTLVLAVINILPYYYLGNAFVFTIAVSSLAVFAFRNPNIFKVEEVKYANSTLQSEEIKKHLPKILDLFDKEKIYLNPDLTLAKLGKQLGLNTKQVSQIINQTQQINYSQFVAKYRVETAKKMLASNKYANAKIATIAYDSGFNSISSFNKAFKKIVGITAKEYKDSSQNKIEQ